MTAYALVICLHALACLALVGASIRRMNHPVPGDLRHFLLPFCLAAGVLGMFRIYPIGVEWFVSEYSGIQLEPVPGEWFMRYVDFHQFVMPVLLVLPLLPFAGAMPFPGRRPWPMAAAGILALLPAVFELWLLVSQA